MKVIVYLLGIGIIALSSFLILYTRENIDILKRLIGAYPLKYLAVLPVVVGVFLMVAAQATFYPWIFRVIGLLAFCEAALAFTNPQQIYSRMLDWYLEKLSIRTHQLLGIIGVIFGTCILTWAK